MGQSNSKEQEFLALVRVTQYGPKYQETIDQIVQLYNKFNQPSWLLTVYANVFIRSMEKQLGKPSSFWETGKMNPDEFQGFPKRPPSVNERLQALEERVACLEKKNI